MVTLVPNNNQRVEVQLAFPDSSGTLTPVTGASVTLRLSDSPTSSTNILSYVATEYSNEPGTYYADFLGVNIASIDTQYMHDRLVIQIFSGTVLAGYVEAKLEPARRLQDR